MHLNATAGTLLGFLMEEPMAGWDLMSVIDASVGNFWNVTRSQVYRELTRLADAGLVVEGTAGPRDRRPHAITDSGRAAFQRWLADGPPGETRRIPVLLSTFFGRNLSPARLRAILDAEDRRAAAELASYDEIGPLVADPFQRATLEFGLRYAQLVRSWIDEVAGPLADEATTGAPLSSLPQK